MASKIDLSLCRDSKIPKKSRRQNCWKRGWLTAGSKLAVLVPCNAGEKQIFGSHEEATHQRTKKVKGVLPRLDRTVFLAFSSGYLIVQS